MELDDIDWRSGVLTISGKGLQRDRLPVPQDVGEALASYLLDGRPQCTSRQVFVRLRAPHRRFASCVAISSIVARAVDRAGLHPQRRGAHALRHTLASEMLRQGASLSEIGQVLRHRSVSSTEIYAKVDIDGLRPLAQPWPGEGA
jgi:site-specific recombinase XerD